MTVIIQNDSTARNRIMVTTGNAAVTPASGTSIDGQGAPGQLVIGTSALTPNSSTGVLVTIALNYPSFTDPGTGRACLLAGTPLSGTASAAGTAALAEYRDNLGNTQIKGLSVGTTGTDIIITNTTIQVGGLVTCTSGQISG